MRQRHRDAPTWRGRGMGAAVCKGEIEVVEGRRSARSQAVFKWEWNM